MKAIKYIDIKEFREKGYLQEVNRRFLHPLGLALEVKINEDGTEVLGGVWDYREDSEGIYYDIENSDEERINNFKRKRNFIDSELEIIGKNRMNKLGFIEEPIESKDSVIFYKCREFVDDVTNILMSDIIEFVDGLNLCDNNNVLKTKMNVYRHLMSLTTNVILNRLDDYPDGYKDQVIRFREHLSELIKIEMEAI
jgi:hypothetical protein